MWWEEIRCVAKAEWRHLTLPGRLLWLPVLLAGVSLLCLVDVVYGWMDAADTSASAFLDGLFYKDHDD